MSGKVLMKGNEAFAEAAIRGGCRYYFGYPITPQNEIPEYMSHQLPNRGGYFIQAESELAAVYMAYGCGAAGGRVFISSSSPGIALMQEGFSFMCATEVPTVALTVSRCGPGIGGIQPAQADYFQATRGGGNGDYKVPVFAPSSIQEGVDLVYECMGLADEYRNPMFVFTDGLLAQMMEPIVLPEQIPFAEPHEIRGKKPWALTGYGDDDSKKNSILCLYIQPEELEKHVHDIFEKYKKAEKELVRVETIGVEDAEVVLVAFGTMARITKEAIEILAARGVKAGLIRPISLWPYPYGIFDALTDKTKLVISAELSMGQMIQDVNLGVKGRFPVKLLNRTGGVVPTPLEVAERTKKILEEMGGLGR